MLIQQPEAHLHPQAQAALGSFFARLAQSGGPSLVLESHSDFILDRVRIEVAKSRLDTEKVQILYLEKTGNRTHVYPIRVDDCGNVVDAPPSYRQFFMREEMSLLTRTSRT
jgi:predicted ATPase